MSRIGELRFTLRTKEIEVPGCAGKVVIRELSTGEWQEVAKTEAEKQTARIVSLAVLAPDGKQAFEKDDPDISQLSLAAVESIVTSVSKMNQVDEDTVKN